MEEFHKFVDEHKVAEEASHEPAPKKLRAISSIATNTSGLRLSSSSVMGKFLNNSAQYKTSHPNQLKFENNLCMLTAKAFTPLCLCENPAFLNMVHDLDCRIKPVSRSRLTRTLLPSMKERALNKVKENLQDAVSVSIQYDLWMTRKTEEIFSLNGTVMKDWNLKVIHLGMPWCVEGTDGQQLSSSVRDCLKVFNIQDKIVSYTSDGGSNLKACKNALDMSVTNSMVFGPMKRVFEQDCFAHALQGACKAAVLDVKSPDGSISVEKTRGVMQKCITWTKKSQKGATFLAQSQEHCGLRPKRMLTPVKTRFAYLIHSFRALLENRPAIDYLYSEKPGMSAKLRERKPSWQDWEVTQMIISTMKSVVTSTTLNQACGKRWGLADAIIDFIEVFRQCQDGAVNKDVEDQCSKILDQHGHDDEAVTFCENLKSVSNRMRCEVREKLLPFLKPLLRYDCPDEKSHLFFALLLDPRYANLKVLLKLHRTLNFVSQPYISMMISKFYSYLVAAEERKNPVPVHRKPGRAENEGFFSNEISFDLDDAGLDICNIHPSTMDRAKQEFKSYQVEVQLAMSTDGRPESMDDVLQFYRCNGRKFPMVTLLSQIVLAIPSSQIDNERDFSLAGNIGRSRRSSITVDNLGTIMFINKNVNEIDQFQNIFTDSLQEEDID